MLVIAHRGASGHAPENTRAAFEKALAMGARAIELDVHQTHDGEIVVAHDDDLKRCARDRRKLRDLRWAGQAEFIDVGAWFGKEFAGQRLMRLADVYELVPPTVELHVELKHGSKFYPGIEDRVLAVARGHRAVPRTLFSSFDHAALKILRTHDAAARLAYLAGLKPLRASLQEAVKIKCEAFNVSTRQANARLVKSAKTAGLKVFVYTVNTPVERDRLVKIGVDGIFSNYPELDLWH